MKKSAPPKTLKQFWKLKRQIQLKSFRDWVIFAGHGDRVRDHIDMNVLEFRKYIEAQMLPGMTWENYRKEWVIDHIVALKYFNPTDMKDMALCWNYNNLKPSWFDHNHAKGYCVEVTVRILEGLPQNAMVKSLLRKVEPVRNMFEPYYKTA